MIIKKSVYQTLKRHKINNDNEAHEKYLKKCMDTFTANDTTDEGDNLLSVYIKSSKGRLDLKTIDKMYKQGHVLQKSVMTHAFFVHYIDLIFKNLQKDRLIYFNQTDVESEKRLAFYVSLMTNYRFGFFNYYNNEENIEYLKKQNLLKVLFGEIGSPSDCEFNKVVESNKKILEKLNEKNVDLLSICNFENSENIYDFGMFHIVMMCPGYYMETYSIKPEKFKEKLISDFPDIYNEFLKLKSYVEKLSITKEINDVTPEEKVKHRL